MIEINKDNYKKEIEQSKGLVLLDFWAPWCGMCRKLKAIIEQIEAEGCNIKIASINIEDYPEMKKRYTLGSLPTLVFMKDNQELSRYSGAISKTTLIEIIKGAIK